MKSRIWINMYLKKVNNDINLMLRIQTKEDLPHKVWIRTVSIFTILASNDKSPIIQHGLQRTYQQQCHFHHIFNTDTWKCSTNQIATPIN